MRTRLLASVAVFAAVLLAPSAASATMTAPVVSAPTPTNSVVISWADVSDELGYRVLRADGDCLATPIFVQVGVDLAMDSTGFTDTTLTLDGTYCYYVEAFDALDDGVHGGVGNADSTPITVEYDNTQPGVTLIGVATNAKVHGTLPLTATASDTGSGVASVTFGYRQGSSGPFTTIGVPDTTGPSYGASFDTSGVGDNTYEIRALAADAAGNTLADTVTNVLVDNAPPSASLSAPLAAAKIRGTIVADATASDVGAGVGSVAFQSAPAGSGTWTTYDTDSSGPSPYHGTLDTMTLAGDGLYDLRVLVSDLAGNITPSATAANVRVDNTVPTASLTAPVAGTAVRGTINADATASDGSGSGVTSVTFQSSPAGAGTWTTFDSDISPAYQGTLNTTLLSDGLYDLRVLATDGATNSAPSTTVANVRVDNTAPTVTLGGVAGDSNVHATLLLTSASADTGGSGVASVAFGRRAAGSSGSYTTIGAAVTTPPYQVSFDTTAITDGDYQLQALATDLAGNTLSASVTNVRIDNHVPATPSAPTGLTPVAAAPTITFGGTTDPLFGGVASGVDHYDVYRDGAQVNAAPIVDAGAGPYTWSDVAGSSTNPAAGTNTYSYRVLAVDKAGNASAQSGAKLIVLDPAALSAPGSVAAAATTTNQRPQLSWVAPPAPPFSVDHYDIFRNGGTTPIAVVVAPTTAYTDATPSLADGTYTYQVVAASVGDVTLGVASGAVAVTYDTTAPTAPVGVAAAAALDGSISINWAAAGDGAGSGIARYVVRRALSASAPATIADGDASCQGTATSCADVTALNGKLYSYAVFTVDRAGNTSAAGIALAVTARDQVAPAVPKGLAATPGDASVDLRWTAAAADDDVAGYVLVAKQGTGAPAGESDGTRVCSALVAASTTCTATGLTNGATYTFGLFALDEALNRSQAAVVSAAPNGHVTDVRAPAAVTKLNAEVTGHTVTLTWKNPADRDFDHVLITASERKPAGRAASKRVYSGKGTKATTRLASGQSRWFVVVAYDAVGNASAPATVRAAVAVLSRFGPAPRAKVHGKVRLTWPVVKRARYYNVQIYAGKRRILVSWPAGRALQLPRAKLKRGTRYTWYVWPGLGAKAKAHYGKLIGKNVFTFTG